MANIAKFKRLTVAQSEKSEDTQLFVINKSNPAGNVNFVVSDSNNNRTAVQVPITFIPMDLTLFAKKNDVLGDPNFRKLVARGFLHIVDTEDAEKFLETPKAKEELNKVLGVINNEDDAFQPPVDQSVNAEAPEKENVSQFAKNILLRTQEEDVANLISELESKIHTLTINDIQYIMDNTANNQLKTWCSEAIEILSEDEDESTAG